MSSLCFSVGTITDGGLNYGSDQLNTINTKKYLQTPPSLKQSNEVQNQQQQKIT